MQNKNDVRFLEEAIKEAKLGVSEGGVPIGAVLVVGDEIVGRGRNRRVQEGSAIHHGETNALEDAGRLPASVYAQATMYTTLSPCAMCTGAMLLYGIPRVVIGENVTFMGEEELLRSRGVDVIVADNEDCKALMAEFVCSHPEVWNEDIGEELASQK